MLDFIKGKENFLKDKTILITGGTGFLGKALIREILKYNPHSIRIFSRDEFKHHQLQEIFNNNEKIRNLIGDVRDYPRLTKAIRGVDIVIHAAALKRIDMIEYNVEEAVKTNILGSLNVIQACLENNVGKAIFVSTDKACAPINTYGACKFVSERIFTESNYNKGNSRTIFTVVRYGNVLESTGSVIPFFVNKIKNKEIIPLTDEKMTRFIINSKQAVHLIFKAIRYGVGGEVFIPRLPSMKIIDLIAVLKEKFNVNSSIKKVGVRPGEKIHELMINDSEIPRTYQFRDFYVITSCILNQYQDVRKPIYITDGEKLDESLIKEYSSKDALISKDKLHEIIDSLNI
jgi:UDP-N-acetylglucosamine 4,6-dehydratase